MHFQDKMAHLLFLQKESLKSESVNVNSFVKFKKFKIVREYMIYYSRLKY